MPTPRPGPLRWLYHQYGGALPTRYRDWVLHDATTRTWLLRALVRRLVQIAPVLAVLLVGLGAIGGSWPIALGAALLGCLVFLRFALAYAAESVDHRLVRHGYPAHYGSAVRQQAEADRRRSGH